MQKKFTHLISYGEDIPLEVVPFHSEAPLKRLLMSGATSAYNFNMHIAIHEIGTPLKRKFRDYSVPHSHNCDEWNILISSEKLIFEILLGDEKYEVLAPATVFIPKGLIHAANVLEGKGHFIAIVDTVDYDNSFIPPSRDSSSESSGS